MGAIFELARRDISAVMDHLECVQLELALIERIYRADELDNDLSARVERLVELGAVSPSRRLIVYAAAVIALYGAFERFVEELLETYASGYPVRIPRYMEVDQAVKDQHLRLSLDLAARAVKDGSRSKLSVSHIIQNLAGCMVAEQDAPYVFNAEAFRVHFGNIRAAKLSELFSAVGIGGILSQITKVPPLSKWILDEVAAGRLVKQDGPKLAFLDDFVERRNEIAHGQPVEMMSLDLIGRYSQFLLALCESLERVTIDRELGDSCRQLHSIGSPLAILKKINVVTFDLTNAKVTVGSKILVKRSSATGLRHIEFIIESLMVGDKPRKSVTARKTPVPVGIRISGTAANGEYFV